MNIKEIKKQLSHGAIKQIARNTGFSATLISLTLKGVGDSPKKVEIIKAAAKIIKEHKRNEQKALAYLKDAIEC